MRSRGVSPVAFLAVGVALIVGVPRAAAPQTAPRKEELPHPKTLEELQAAMKQELDKEHVPGAGVAPTVIWPLVMET